MSDMKPRRATRLAAAAAVAAAAITLAGCGGASSPVVPSLSAAAGHTAHTAQSRQASLAEALHLAGQCMRQHGISGLPDPTVGSDGQVDLNKSQLLAAPKSVQDRAVMACRAAFIAAQAATGHPAANAGPPSMSQLLAFSRCMRAHGIPNFPDPAPGTGEITLPPGTAKTSPILAAASRACQHLVSGGVSS
jgi:hypothetical protein